jgi:hypothetical protein
MDQLDWSAPELLDALEAEYWNGFGFQCDAKQSHQPTRIYVAQPWNMRHTPGSFSRGADYVPAWNDAVDLAVVRNALPADIPHEDVWITDFIGHDFVTVHTRQYLNIPRILNAFLAAGYGFWTHTCVKVRYVPGDPEFTRLSFERKVIEQLRKERAEWQRLKPNEPNTWRIILGFVRNFPLVQHWNWITPEGKALCDELRQALHKKSPRCKHAPRMMWPNYAAVAQRYGILHAGGWSAYDTGLPAPIPAVPAPAAPEPAALAPDPMSQGEDDADDEVLCSICFAEPPDTIAQPCGHVVVCHTCSDKLAAGNTVNKKRCVQCQRPITHVEK